MMKDPGLKKMFAAAMVMLMAMAALAACKQDIQAMPLGKDQYCIEGERITVSLAEVTELAETGVWINIESKIPSVDETGLIHCSIIVVCTGLDHYVVASRTNHKEWSLTYDPEKQILVSSDGKRKFNMDGSVIGEKPKQPLTIHTYTLEEGSLVIDIGN